MCYMCLNRKLYLYSFLQELGVVLWTFRYPVLSSKKFPIKFFPYLRWLLVSSFLIKSEDTFVKDVFRAMCVNIKEVCVLSIEQIDKFVVPRGFICNVWWAGVGVSYDFRGLCLITPSLSVLKCNVYAKKELWNQINKIILNNKQ